MPGPSKERKEAETDKSRMKMSRKVDFLSEI
jgi:hypothetical protein